MSHGNRDLDYLKRIHASCVSIKNERAAIKGDDDFYQQTVPSKGVSFDLIQISEYIKKLSPSAKQLMPSVDKKLIHALRNVLVHDYGSANGQTIF